MTHTLEENQEKLTKFEEGQKIGYNFWKYALHKCISLTIIAINIQGNLDTGYYGLMTLINLHWQESYPVKLFKVVQIKLFLCFAGLNTYSSVSVTTENEMTIIMMVHI